ncbi:hypothetical protein ACJJTC_009457 [Scirpophaga incertulas]
MRWITVILVCTLAATTWADPDPKKYKSQVKDKKPSSALTEEERQFLREVEAKFGIKSEVPLDDIKTTPLDKDEKQNATAAVNLPFPAVIAIEIVNDTDSNSKGKRTIDGSLGYGYKTNNGYTYTYLGKQQEKGKFVIYPYSQHDIPPRKPISVEITPSRAYELVEMNDDKHSYNSKKHSRPNYENIKGLVSPPPLPHNANPTFYTTYNGHEFSALTGQFPTLMSDYFVDPSQLLKTPQYQSAGISQDYMRNHGSQIDHKVVPVLVLRVPSSYLKKPTAELYSNLPNNYPVSHYLNNINLQELVNNYFAKIGYTAAPQVTTYQSAEPVKTLAVASAPNYERQNYASPYVNPTYTHSDHSGVQYSAVQPVMAKYPTTYIRPQYYMPMAHTHFHQSSPHYEYTYQYMPQSDGKMHGYYIQTQHQTQKEAAYGVQNQNVAVEEATSSPGHAVYGIPEHAGSQESVVPSSDYGAPHRQMSANNAPANEVHYQTTHEVSQHYAQQSRQPSVEYTTAHAISAESGPAEPDYSNYHSPQSGHTHYGVPNSNIQKETLAIYDSAFNQQIPKYIMNAVKAGMQSYYYQKQMKDESAGDSLVLTENYPSKDHTLATVLPVAYTRSKAVQIVSYVTPAPHKYQSAYKVMVPQTVLKNPVTEKVMYVNSHSLPTNQAQSQEYNPEEEYTLPAHYAPPVSSQKSTYPRNYHVFGKRNAKPANKSDSTKSQRRQSTRIESNKQ